MHDEKEEFDVEEEKRWERERSTVFMSAASKFARDFAYRNFTMIAYAKVKAKASQS